MIWATVNSWSCFCWLYRASPSLAAKNIINLISALIVWWCPHVESSLVLLEEGVCYDQCIFLGPNMSALRWLGSQERWPVLRNRNGKLFPSLGYNELLLFMTFFWKIWYVQQPYIPGSKKKKRGTQKKGECLFWGGGVWNGGKRRVRSEVRQWKVAGN